MPLSAAGMSVASSGRHVRAIVGGLNIDSILETDRIPGLGETKDATSSSQYQEGKGANTAVATVRACYNCPEKGLRPIPTSSDNEIKICFNNAVGKDSFGPVLIEELEKKGVEVTGIQIHETEPSDTHVVLVETDHDDSRNIGYPGAYMQWQPSEVNSIQCLTGSQSLDLVMVSLDQKRGVVEGLLFTAYNTGIPCLHLTVFPVTSTKQ